MKIISNKIKKTLKEDNFQSLLNNIITALIGIAGFSILARKLSMNEFSEYIIFITGGSIIEMIRFGLTSNALVCFLAGANSSKRKEIIGSFVKINLMISLLFSLIILGIYFSLASIIKDSSFDLFFSWYPYILMINVPFNNALAIFQADIKFDKILLIRTLHNALYFLVILIGTVYFTICVNELVSYFLIIQLFLSLLCVLLSWDHTNFIRNATSQEIKRIINFGKFSVFTLLGTNLLRNADLFIIGLGSLGSNAVAIYSIPMKITELIQIPLRSFAATAYPKIAKAYAHKNPKKIISIFNTYTGAISLFFIVIVIFIIAFDKELIILISGHNYLDNATEQLNILLITKILAIYGLLLPIDRMTGITLDGINKPQINSLKVIIMLTTNIIGDIIAVFIFKSLELVALTSIFFTLIGSYLGIYFLNRKLKLSLRNVLSDGVRFYQNFSKIHFQIPKK